MRTVPSMPLGRLLTLLAAVAIATALLVTWLTGTAIGEDEGANAGDPPVNEGALELVTRPDLHPPSMSVTLTSQAATPGYYFVTQGSTRYGDTGPMIVDGQGQPVWVGGVPDGQNATTFEVQRYRGRPVLTWWEGRIDKDVGMGIGIGVILDENYRKVATVHAGNGRPTDLHDFVITPRDTALLLIYQQRTADLRRYGGRAAGRILDNLVQEVDIATGRVLFEWSAFDHVPPDESYQALPSGGGAWDAYHLNSVEMDESGDLLVSARHTWAVYKIDPDTGDVVWRLGGKQTDFELGPGARFAWQHDAGSRPDGTLSLFDNQAASPELVEGDQSRGMILKLDERRGTATLVREFTHPAGLLAPSQGNLQNLPSGHVLVGWGSEPHLSEYDEAGRLVFDARFYATAQSYRAFLGRWDGMPTEPPAVVARAEGDGTRVYVSWNGATRVRSWRVWSATSQDDEPVLLTTAPKDGFETAVLVDDDGPYYIVEALDGDGRVIGTSALVRVTAPAAGPTSASPSASDVSSRSR
jgi:Arylsulfotransferase (ASST)